MNFKLLNKLGTSHSSLNRRFVSNVSSDAVKRQADQTASRIAKLTEPVLYYGRVGFEFLRQVARQQQLGPPSPAEWTKAQQGLVNFKNAIQQGSWKKLTVGEAGQYAIKGVEILGFFYVGEIIGRRSLIGYNVTSGNSHGHH